MKRPFQDVALPDWSHPDRVLDPQNHADTDWARALTRGDATSAIQHLVQTFRGGPDLDRPARFRHPLTH
jgi:hypothetical protein